MYSSSPAGRDDLKTSLWERLNNAVEKQTQKTGGTKKVRKATKKPRHNQIVEFPKNSQISDGLRL
jgi:hypothetical protein